MIDGENRPKGMMLRHWERFALQTDTKPRLVKKVMTDLIMRVESALPIVTERLGLRISKPDELLMIDNIKKLILRSLTEMKDKLKNTTTEPTSKNEPDVEANESECRLS